MESLNRIPKILESVEQLRGDQDIEKVFESYKKNVRVFIQTMKQEVSSLIKNYQKTIHDLTLEIKTLKGQQSSSHFIRTPQLSKYYSSSPTKGKTSDLMQTTNSNVSTPFKLGKFEDLPISSIYKKKRSIDQSQFPEILIPQQSSVLEKSGSRFQQSNKKRKQRQQQLRLSLQSGKNNLNVTTDQFHQVIGRNKSKKRIEESDEQQERQLCDSPSKIKREQSLNQSLGQICESLDTSYISQKSRSQKKKKLLKMQEQLKRKQQIQKQTAKQLKDRGLKSLLQRLRNNVQTSPYQAPQVITSSRLISTGKSKEKSESMSPSRKNSKVMINPVPVDIARRSKATSRSGESLSPQKKPQSILKRSSTLLSRSITSYSFHDMTL